MKTPLWTAALVCLYSSLTPEATAAVVLAIDVDERTADGSAVVGSTQEGFQSFVIGNAGGNVIQNTPTTRTFGALSVTLAGVAGNVATTGTTTPGFGSSIVADYDDRIRGSAAAPQPNNSPTFTLGNLLGDFVFSRDNNNGGLDITIGGLVPSTNYTLELWSFDNGSTGTRVSDWTANGALIQEDYTFSGTNNTSFSAPDDDFGKFTATITTDASGSVLLSGRRDETSRGTTGNIDFGVFFNGLRVSTIPEPSAALMVLAGAALGARRRSRR